MALTDNPNPLYGLNASGIPNYIKRMDTSMIYDVESQLLRGTMSFAKDKLN